MADSNRVHIVRRRGPEWSDIIEVFAEKSDAQSFATKRNNAIPRMTNPTERLSYYDVTTRLVTPKVVAPAGP